jgi:hypothetical protein
MIIMVQKITKVLGLVALMGLNTALDAQYFWSPAGPVNTAGRVRNMIVDNTDPSNNTLYVGSTSSGIFKSTNGGVNWLPLDDQGSIRNISYMAQAPDGTIYAATGEGFLRAGQKSKALPGTGLYKLAGNTLVQVVSNTVVGNEINRVAVSPNNAAHIAITTNQGVYVSTNSGSSFALANGIPTSSLIVGQDVKFDGNGILYCSAGSAVGVSTVAASRVYKSSSAALTNFTNITPTASILPDDNYGRIELAISPSNNNVIYASCANKFDNPSPASSSLKGLFVSYSGGTGNAPWALVLQGAPHLDPLSNGGTLSSGDYAHTLLVDPTNPNQLFVGSFQTYVFTRTPGVPGDSDGSPIGIWRKLGNNFAIGSPFFLNQNVHDIKIIPGNPLRVFFITDAGIFRSTDLETASAMIPPSFQPFYKGLVTGQFNSVSIQRYPIGANSTSTVNGAKVTPYTGFIGGTGGNGMTYFSGTYSFVTQESSYIGGEVYNAEFSKILPDAAIASSGSGILFRSTNVKSSPPARTNVNRYSGILSRLAPNPEGFSNLNATTGTPFKLWEYYGQSKFSCPDSIYFYNDTIRFQSGVETLELLNTTSTFSFTAVRPNKFALIDSIVVRSGTVTLPVSGAAANSAPFTAGQTIYLSLNKNYSVSGTLTTISGTNISSIGPISTALQPSVTLNSDNLIDGISVTFISPPYASVTAANTNPAHYRIFATVFYKYKAGDTVSVIDNNISTKTGNYEVVFDQDLNWRYGSAPQYTGAVIPNAAVSNPTYVVMPGNLSFNTPNYAVNTIGEKSYTITQYGDYTMNARPVVYTLTAATDTNMPGPTYTFVLEPGTITRTATATSTVPVSFTVAPTSSTSTNYTITQTDASTLVAETFSTVGASTYILNPGNITQDSTFFLINLPIGTPPTSYTVEGLSSDVTVGVNTSTVFNNFPIRTVQTRGIASVPFSANNPPVKVPVALAARLAVAVANNAISGNQPAVAVSKNPLALNDPLNFVRVSQNGARTDDASGNPTTNTVAVTGRATLLEWSKSGTELYYATDANSVYRVSHIININDLSPSSNNGKFHNDIFMYNTSSPHTPNSNTINPSSPFRTTLLGTFDAPISSLSIDNNDSLLLVTFNNPAKTGTTGIVMASTNNARKSNSTNIGWVKKDATIPAVAIYCSMIEKDDNNKVYIGTDQGLYYTANISASGGPTWVSANHLVTDPSQRLPNVQVFDIKQQVMEPHDCFNSGQIYIATNGRGIWTNSKYIQEHNVGVEDFGKDKVSVGNNLRLYPNPTHGNVNIEFTGLAGEKAVIQIMDLSGRVVSSENIGQLESGEVTRNVQTNELNSGIYIVNISSDSGIKRVAKLVVTK